MAFDANINAGKPARDFTAVDRRLRQILEPLRSRFSVTKDSPEGMTVEIPGLEGKPWGYVAGVRPGKSYVSFYLMSVYSSPKLMASMSPELRRRMQGKACFNFTKVEEPLFAELARVTKAGLEPFIESAHQADKERTPAKSHEGTRARSRSSAAGIARGDMSRDRHRADNRRR